MSNVYIRALRSGIIGFAALVAVIFISAWTLNYWRGWAFIATIFLTGVPITVYMAMRDKELLERRLNIGPTAEKTATQKIIASAGGLVTVGATILMVLDYRFGWSPMVPPPVSLLGDACVIACMYIYYRTIRENRYAAATVVVEEGQTVCSTGPYAIVRHPMYTGAIIFFIGAPLALGSWWGLLIVPVMAVFFAWRLLDEEKYLAANLSGYTDYMRKVCYRLMPYVW